MKRAIAWCVANPVAANLLLALLLVGGLVSLPAIQQKSLPDFDVDIVQVQVDYPGAAPEEVESGVCIRIEEEIASIEGIDRLVSVAAEGACHVTVEILSDYPLDRALAEIKNAVDAIDSFPDEAEKPVVSHMQIRHNELQIALSGQASERALKLHGERLRDGIIAMTQATQVELTNARNDEISIEVSEESLSRHDLTFDDVVEAVRRSSLDLPGGSLRTPSGEILLRSKGQAYEGAEFERLVVLTRPNGVRLLLGEVAEVVDGFEQDPRYATFDGEPAVMVQVYRVGEQKVLELVEDVKRYVADYARTLPEGLKLTVWRDGSNYLRDRLDVLIRNGVSGFVLVFVVLALFLRLRLALWVAISVPASILGALALFPVFSISIDVLTLFAFILVLGILVDNAIVVGENVYTHLLRSDDPRDAAVRGTQEVAVPIVFGVLTTVTAFLPLLLSAGQTGQMYGTIGLVVTFCLFFSLLESQLVLPSHLAHHMSAEPDEASSGNPGGIGARWKRAQARTSGLLTRTSRDLYRPALERVLHWRYATLSLGLTLLLLAFGLLASGRLPFTYFPKIEGDYITATISLAQGTPVEVTAAAVRTLEQSARTLKREIDQEHRMADGSSVFKHILTSVGEQPSVQSGSLGGGRGSHLGQVAIELVGSNERPIHAASIVDRWRSATPPIPEVEELAFSSDYLDAGAPIDLELRSSDVDQLVAASNRLEAELAAYPGVFDVTDSFRAGKQEIRLAILPAAEALGLMLKDLAGQVRQAFYGEEAQRIQRGREDVKVMVRYPESQRRSLADLDSLRIRTPDGGEVPFHTVAHAERGHGFASIQRTDRQRVISVSADVDPTRTNANQVLADLERRVLPELLADQPGLSYGLAGEQREQAKGLSSLLRTYAFALAMIYVLLAIPLRSYAQPLVIMAVIPFGLVGAIAGHAVMGLEFSMMSVFGIVALSGVIVNSCLVLVHCINEQRELGVPLRQAVGEAGVARFRPIVLTTVTTFAGLTPLLLERRLGAQFLIPMATSLAFGIVFATAISLFLVPSAYCVLEDLGSALRRRSRLLAVPGGPRA